MFPRFRRNHLGELLLSDSPEGSQAARDRPAWSPPLSLELVDKEARERVVARGGNVEDEKDVLGEYTLQSGKYRGRRFRWLLENVPGYIGWFVGEIIKDQGKEDKSGQHQRMIKNAFKRYVMMFEEGREIVQKKKAERGGVNVVQLKQLVARRHLSPAVLQHHAVKLPSPPRLAPIIPSREDRELVACLDEYESSQVAGKPKPPSTITHGITSTQVRPTGAAGSVAVKPKPPSTITHGITSSRVRPTGAAGSVAVKPKPPSTITHGITSSRVRPTGAAGSAPEQPSGSFHSQLTSPAESTVPLLYEKWKSTLPAVDHGWISRMFFTLNVHNRLEFRTDKVTQLWYYPPQPNVSLTIRNHVDRYFGHRLFLWMPVNLWGVQLHCIHTEADGTDCSGILTRAGMHQKTRLVLDVDSFYIMASEYLRCSRCGRKVIAWSHSIVSQLDRDRQLMFPAILTARYSCDRKVAQLMRQRGLGNSSSMVRRQIEEAHGDTYLRHVHHYLTACNAFKTAGSVGLVTNTAFEEPPHLTPIPQHRWLMKVYQLDVLQRLDFIKAAITSLFGTVLKLDSTKKITKKLAGKSAKTAMWATNVGNEHGQVIMSVLTTSEGHGLADMITGICRRYQTAGVLPPRLLYVDRDCCGNSCVLKYFTWPYLLVRLDIWHFMRRLSNGCTTDAHPLYGTFMRQLSRCIFKYEEEDVTLLKKAKRAELIKQHVPDPTDADVVQHITAAELMLHCRRMTRGTVATTTLISQLIQSLEGDKGLDILGVPLIDSVKMTEIWAKQSQHVGCLQDPEDIQLYTKTGTLKKGGVQLPTYRCARGSTSLESFHLHMNRFIPGTLASDVNFQVYLMDGIHRWNEDRRKEAAGQEHSAPLSYDGALQHSVSQLAKKLLMADPCKDFQVPGKYTGELIGLEYLYSQSTGGTVRYQETARSIEEDSQQEEETCEEDEGFEELGDIQDPTVPLLQPEITPAEAPKPILHIPSQEEYQQLAAGISEEADLEPPTGLTTLSGITTGQPEHSLTEIQPSHAAEVQSIPDDSDIGPDNIPGYSSVINLATFLVTMREQVIGLTTEQANEVIRLWNLLSDYDKSRTRFPQRVSSAGSGRFRSKKKQVALGVVSIERAVLGPNATRSNWPDCNRYVEATVERLLLAYPSDKRSRTAKTCKSKWTLVKEAYSRIQTLINSNNRVMDNTDIQLPSLNVKTIQQWHNKKGKARDLKILMQGLQLPQPSFTGIGAPAPKPKPVVAQPRLLDPFHFVSPPDTAGVAKLKVRTPRLQPHIRHILPMPAPPTSAPVLPIPIVLAPATATSSVPSFQPLQMTKRRSEGMEEEVVKRKYTKSSTVKRCSKCGQERHPPQHQQYMGYRFCSQAESLPFEQWRANLQVQGVARKKKLP